MLRYSKWARISPGITGEPWSMSPSCSGPTSHSSGFRFAGRHGVLRRPSRSTVLLAPTPHSTNVVVEHQEFFVDRRPFAFLSQLGKQLAQPSAAGHVISEGFRKI